MALMTPEQFEDSLASLKPARLRLKCWVPASIDVWDMMPFIPWPAISAGG
jgi:hypothetical protein